MTDRILAYPTEYQDYLLSAYGIQPYHPKHLQRLEAAGQRPRPVNLSARRRGIAQSVADKIGERYLEKAIAAA